MQLIILKFNDQEVKLAIRDEVDQSVMREIFKIREYKSAEEKIIGAKDPIIDVGAHAGFFSIYCHLFNPKVKIVAVEPEVENLKALKENLKVNKIKNVKVAAGAIASKTEQRSLVVTEDNQNHRLLEPGEATDNLFTQEVEAYSLKDFCKKNRIKNVSVLKMDIEGGEYEIIDSWEAADWAMLDSIILEYHDIGDKDYKILEQKMRENGFSVQVFPSKFDKTMGFLFAINKRKK